MKYIPFFVAAMLFTSALVAETRLFSLVRRCGTFGSAGTVRTQWPIASQGSCLKRTPRENVVGRVQNADSMEWRSIGDDLNETRQSDTKEKKASSTEIDSLIENLAAVKSQQRPRKVGLTKRKSR